MDLSASTRNWKSIDRRRCTVNRFIKSVLPKKKCAERTGSTCFGDSNRNLEAGEGFTCTNKEPLQRRLHSTIQEIEFTSETHELKMAFEGDKSFDKRSQVGEVAAEDKF
jgi:hypothetical protein